MAPKIQSSMKINAFVLASSVIAILLSTKAADITVPSGSFSGITTNINVPFLLGTGGGSIGAWTGQISSLLSANGSIRCGSATSLGGPAPLQGNYETDVHLPLGLATSASIAQVLTNAWLPNSTYTLSVGLAEVDAANLLSSGTLALQVGTTNVATLSGATLLGLLNDPTNMQSVALVYKTGNTVPTNGVGISLSLASTLSVGGDVYVNDFQLSVVPTQVALKSWVTMQGNSPKVNVSGTGGAPGEAYEIYTTTNLATLTPTWSIMTTNKFDANGNFAQQIPVSASTPCRFFHIVLP